MALTKITTSVVAVNSLTAANIADNSIDATKIANNQILARHIAAGALTDQLGTLPSATISGNLVVDTTTLVVDSSNNRVGIGTTSPSSQFVVAASNGGKGIETQVTTHASNNQFILAYDRANSVYLNMELSALNFGIATNNGTNRFKILSNGNVGIGTTSPNTMLHVDAPASPSPTYPTLGTASGVLGLSINELHGMYLGLDGSSGNGWIQAMREDGTGTAYDLILQPGGGNIGIGTDTPDAKLEIMTTRSSGANARALILHDNVTGVQTTGFGTRIEGRSNNNNAVSAIGFEAFGGTNNDTAIAFYTQPVAGGLARRMIINDDGNVGIGTATPSSKLHLESGNAHNKLSITSTANGGTGYDAVIDLLSSAANSEVAINMGINGDADREQIKTYQSDMTFRTNNTERMFIGSGGELHIGHTQRSAFDSLGTLVVQQIGSGKGIGVIDTSAANTFQMRNESNVGIINHNLASAQIKIGTNNTADLIVDGSSGAITKPNHPCFDAAGVAGGDNSQINFTTTYVNVGGHYSTTTYRFTAPVAGNYLFYTNFIKNNQATTTNRRRFLKNGSVVNGGRHIRLGGEGGNSYDWGSLSQIITLAANDYITVDHYNGDTYGNNEYDSFGGYLIG